MKTKSAFLLIAATAAVVPVNAQSIWNGGAGNWSSNTATGWNGTGVPNAIDAAANIAAATGNITVDGSYVLGTLTAGGTFAGRTLATSSGNLTFDVSSGDALFDLTNGGLAGTGLLVNANLTLNDTLEIRNLVSSGSQQATLSGAISGSGNLTLTNTGTSLGGARFDLRNGSNSFTGGVTVGQGAGLRINASGALGTGTLTRASGVAGGTNDISFRNDTGNSTQTHANDINLGSNASGSWTGFSLANSSMNVTLNGVISGTMGSTNRANLNGGTLVLGGLNPNTWTGQFRSDTHGTIIADKVGALNNGFSMRSQSADSTTALLVGVSDTINGQISVDGNNAGAGFAYRAQLGLKDGNNGTVTFNNANKINLNNAFGIGGTALVPTISLNLHSGNGTGTLVVTTEIGNNSPAARNISITGTGTVNLNRAAGNSYQGSTTVSGGTLLANNTTGSATSTGAVVVNASTRLGGTGIIAPAGASGIDVSGIFAPGASIGNLTLNLANTTGTVAMISGASFEFELGAANPTIGIIGLNTSDLLTIAGAAAGDLAFSSNNVDFLNTGSIGFYKLFDTSIDNASTWSGLVFDGTSGVVSSGLTYSNLAGGLSGSFVVGTASNGGTTGDIYFQVIPEPSAALLGSLGMLAMLRRRR